ncbi:MAG: hypothetical protein PHY47_17765, partial [Lachnospiraceae bacterium]|nr:hypothetical protein [Lachnospiraceae bacterium]
MKVFSAAFWFYRYVAVSFIAKYLVLVDNLNRSLDRISGLYLGHKSPPFFNLYTKKRTPVGQCHLDNALK